MQLWLKTSIKMKISWQIVSVHNSRDSSIFIKSVYTMSREQHNPMTPAIVCQFACSNRTSSFSQYRYAAILWCWQGLSPSRVMRASARALLHRKATHSSRGTLCTVRANNIDRGCHGYRDEQCRLNSFEPLCDYLQQEHAPDAQFGQRSGRGRWAGCRPWRCQWKGSLPSPLNYKQKCINNELIVQWEVIPFAVTRLHLRMSESWP